MIIAAVAALASLFLPDRMSKIIGEGIVTEMEYEYTDDNQPIYIPIPGSEMQLPKLSYEGAGKLVTQKIDGKHYAIIVGAETQNGQPIVITIPGYAESVPVPKFLRTADGTPAGEPKQGTLLMDENGIPKYSLMQRSDMKAIWRNGLIMLGITFAMSCLSIGVSFLSSHVGNGFGRDIRKGLFSKVLALSVSQEDRFTSASLITRTTNDVTQVQQTLIMALRLMINVPVIFVGAMIMALSKDPQMTLVLLVAVPIVVITIILVARIIIPLFKTLQKRIDRLTLVSREIITGIRVIRAFGGEASEDKRFDTANKDVTDIGLKIGKIMSALIPLMTIVMSFTSLSIVLIASFSVDKGLKAGTMDFTRLGNMMAVIQYVMQIMISIIMLSMIFIMVPKASVSAQRIGEVIDLEPDIVSPENPIEAPRNGAVEFENVSFAFSEKSKNVVDNISFSANKGTVTAIVGGTGSGKSTLINLIPRLYDSTQGKVKLDGVDVKDFSLSELRSRIGFITQKAVLFSGTIKENILYGAKDDKNLELAAQISQSEAFIKEKEGYDAEVEQGGGNFSGGQKQRLSIARAIAKGADVLIFDDSFSALDYTTDAKLRKELKKITKDKTVLIVAQRIGTVMDADKILVLDEGRLVGEGTHYELLRNCPVYRELALSQLTEKELGLEASNG